MRISDWSSDVCSSDLQTSVIGFTNLPLQVGPAAWALGAKAIAQIAMSSEPKIVRTARIIPAPPADRDRPSLPDASPADRRWCGSTPLPAEARSCTAPPYPDGPAADPGGVPSKPARPTETARPEA